MKDAFERTNSSQIQTESVNLTLCRFRCEHDHRREHVTRAKYRSEANLLTFDQLVHSRLATGSAAVWLSFVPVLSYKMHLKEHCIFQSSSNYSFKILFLLVPLSQHEVSLFF